MIGYIISKNEKNFFKRLINKIEIKEFENGREYLIPKFNKKLLNQLEKDNIKNVVIAKKDKDNIEFINVISSKKINILNGKILFKHLIPEIIEYLSKVLEINKKNMELTILVNDYSNINLNYIMELISTNRRINIITNNMKKFKIFSDKLYEEEAILIPIMNNRNKSLANKNIILNIDFSEEQLKKYKINRRAIIINIENTVNSISKTFAGININNYELNIEKRREEFTTNEVYESYIIGKSYKEIREKITKDNIKISNLIGKNGIIDISEYKK